MITSNTDAPTEVPPADTPAATDRALMTIAEFCERYHISVGLYHKLRRAGRGPQVVEIMKAVRITPQAAEAWLERMKTDSRQELSVQPGGMSSARPSASGRTGRPAGSGGKTRRATGVQPTFPSGKPIGRPRKTDAPARR